MRGADRTTGVGSQPAAEAGHVPPEDLAIVDLDERHGTTHAADEGEPSVKGVLRQIGEVAEAVGLSLRTVRFYEEAGLVLPVRRSRGGFRLYDDESIDRFRIIMQMKPLGFTLDEMRILIDARAALARPELDAENRETLRERLRMFVVAADEKVVSLREQLAVAERFAAQLRKETEVSGTGD
jgi:MerR family copper efflux transcriptional regulator